MELKKSFSIGILLVAVAGGYYLGNSNVKSDTKIEYRDKTVTQEKIIYRSNGERVITRTIKSDVKSKTRIVERQVRKNTILTLSAPIYGVSDERQAYTFGISKRVLGEAFAGVYGNTRGEIGVSLSYMF
jgi:hypothetical protein